MFIIRLNKNNKLLSVFKSLFRNKLTNDIRNNDIAPDIASKTVATLKAGSKLLVSSAILTKKNSNTSTIETDAATKPDICFLLYKSFEFTLKNNLKYIITDKHKVYNGMIKSKNTNTSFTKYTTVSSISSIL